MKNLFEPISAGIIHPTWLETRDFTDLFYQDQARRMANDLEKQIEQHAIQIFGTLERAIQQLSRYGDYVLEIENETQFWTEERMEVRDDSFRVLVEQKFRFRLKTAAEKRAEQEYATSKQREIEKIQGMNI